MEINRHTDRIKSNNPEITGRAVALYRDVLDLYPMLREKAAQLKISTNPPMNKNASIIYSEDGAQVYWIKDTLIVYIYFIPEESSETSELEAGQIGPL